MTRTTFRIHVPHVLATSHSSGCFSFFADVQTMPCGLARARPPCASSFLVDVAFCGRPGGPSLPDTRSMVVGARPITASTQVSGLHRASRGFNPNPSKRISAANSPTPSHQQRRIPLHGYPRACPYQEVAMAFCKRAASRIQPEQERCLSLWKDFFPAL